MNQRGYVGPGSILHLGHILRALSASRVLVVAGRSSFQRSGAKDKLDSVLAGCKADVFCEYEHNPKIEDVMKGVDVFRKDDYDALIAIGGGSAIDMAKSIRYLAVNPYVLTEMQPTRLSVRPKPMIAVPTTVGSGSEATHFAVLYVGVKKHSIAHECILPEIYILDPELAMSLPPSVVASSGADALTQAIEAFWSVNSTEESRAYARSAVAMILSNLPAMMEKRTLGTCMTALIAAHLAGKAINVSKTTAAHALSYPLTSLFGISHGQAVGLLLPRVYLHNSGVTADDVVDERGVSHVRARLRELDALFGCPDASASAAYLAKFFARVGLATELGALGVGRSDLQAILDNVNAERLGNNPRRMTGQDLKQILHELL